jgi:hypothetical protein
MVAPPQKEQQEAGGGGIQLGGGGSSVKFHKNRYEYQVLVESTYNVGAGQVPLYGWGGEGEVRGGMPLFSGFRFPEMRFEV